MMNDQERDELLIELKSDVKWIKQYIANLDKFKLLVWAALFTALLGMAV